MVLRLQISLGCRVRVSMWPCDTGPPPLPHSEPWGMDRASQMSYCHILHESGLA